MNILSRLRSQFSPPARELLFSSPSRTNQDEVERRFFSSIRLHNGTLKVTASKRHDDLNTLILQHLPATRPLRLMDVGVSSGITTVEWLESLKASGIACRMLAGDLTAHAHLWTLGRYLHILTEEDGHPLQYEVAGFAFSHAPRRRDALLFFVPAKLSRSLFRLAAKKVPLGVRRQRVALVSPRLTASADLEVVDDNVLHPWQDARRFDVVRAANVLNPAYFSEAQLVLGLESLRQRLVVGGLMVLCRTQGVRDGEGNHASLLRLEADGRLAVIARLRGGSELERLAVALPSVSPASASAETGITA